MVKTRTIAIALALAIILLVSIKSLNFSITGFSVLQPESASQKSSGKTQTQESGVSARLSMEALQDTMLDVNLVEDSIEQCPLYLYLVFDVENSGKENAERLFVSPSENLKVLECTNCNSTMQLKPLEKTTVRLKACKTGSEKAFVSFHSINSNEARVEIK
ncbi:MAG TPA: hypothetical protein HA227_00285 [Candidatus Diapherotrites archaeon]|uniref:Uncharacterized protein n=1 Tax=Candidatus Iainarchaeum sp. TaxID=3101447 RepID=A0A7J4KWK1_9ARCH|nr:hypothetical protein [Candidatus Diapherotrites archaeon]